MAEEKSDYEKWMDEDAADHNAFGKLVREKDHTSPGGKLPDYTPALIEMENKAKAAKPTSNADEEDDDNEDEDEDEDTDVDTEGDEQEEEPSVPT
jgi:hypothetical protein